MGSFLLFSIPYRFLLRFMSGLTLSMINLFPTNRQLPLFFLLKFSCDQFFNDLRTFICFVINQTINDLFLPYINNLILTTNSLQIRVILFLLFNRLFNLWLETFIDLFFLDCVLYIEISNDWNYYITLETILIRFEIFVLYHVFRIFGYLLTSV